MSKHCDTSRNSLPALFIALASLGVPNRHFQRFRNTEHFTPRTALLCAARLKIPLITFIMQPVKNCSLPSGFHAECRALAHSTPSHCRASSCQPIAHSARAPLRQILTHYRAASLDFYNLMVGFNASTEPNLSRSSGMAVIGRYAPTVKLIAENPFRTESVSESVWTCSRFLLQSLEKSAQPFKRVRAGLSVVRRTGSSRSVTRSPPGFG